MTVVDAVPPRTECQIIERTGAVRIIPGKLSSASWLPAIRQAPAASHTARLGDIALRISCGVATGADAVFVHNSCNLAPELLEFGHPTLAGREIVSSVAPAPRSLMLVPYRADGSLMPESELGPLGNFLRSQDRRERLLRRTCVRTKPWYAFHETPPLMDLLRPKLLCKDIGAKPVFIVDHAGTIVPRHSVYYIVPNDPAMLHELHAFLNSDAVALWLHDHCQRAANGFLRVQSHVLRHLPLPSSLQPTTLHIPLYSAGQTKRRTA